MNATGNPTTLTARLVVSLDNAVVAEARLSRQVTVVGRHRACDIVIDHPSISGRHMLLRKVDRTYFIEDLASTNGTRVNGVAIAHQAVRHRDQIELGRHRIDFLEEELPAAQASALEKAERAESERALAAADAHAKAGKAAGHHRDDGLSRTMALQRDPTIRLGPRHEEVRTEDANAASALALRVAQGARQGELVEFDRTNTMIGTSGGETALVVKRGRSLYLARFSGNRAPRLNHKELGPGTHPIASGDVIEVGDTVFEVIAAA
jgi:pSer/pThr/pTyr-binding forkhead associated (FHA) protein